MERRPSASGGENFARVDIYDPETDVWGSGPELPSVTSFEVTIDFRDD